MERRKGDSLREPCHPSTSTPTTRQISGTLLATRAKAGLMDMTLWHADRQADILFPIEPFWFVPMHIGQEQGGWGGNQGWHQGGWQEPQVPQQIQTLFSRVKAIGKVVAGLSASLRRRRRCGSRRRRRCSGFDVGASVVVLSPRRRRRCATVVVGGLAVVVITGSPFLPLKHSFSGSKPRIFLVWDPSG